MREDNRRRRIPQSLLPTPEEIEKSPLWQSVRCRQEALRDMRERGLLPRISSEMTEKLRQMREALENPDLEKVIREQRERRQCEIDEERPPSKRGPGAPRLEF